MTDSKYGRLFTERDVLMLLRYAANRGDVDGIVKLGQADGLNVDPGQRLLAEYEAEASGGSPFEDSIRLTFPPDEPLFLLRGQDEAAPAAVRDYGHRADDVGAGAVHLGKVSVAALRLDDWQREHPDRVKVPD